MYIPLRSDEYPPRRSRKPIECAHVRALCAPRHTRSGSSIECAPARAERAPRPLVLGLRSTVHTCAVSAHHGPLELKGDFVGSASMTVSVGVHVIARGHR